MRIFIGMARDRLDALTAAPGAPVTAHVRAVALVLLILARDVVAIRDLWSASGAGSVAAALGISGLHQLATSLSGGGAAAWLGGGSAEEPAAVLGGATEAVAGEAVAGKAAMEASLLAAAAAAEQEQRRQRNVSRVLLCAYDLAIILIEGVKTLVKYGECPTFRPHPIGRCVRVHARHLEEHPVRRLPASTRCAGARRLCAGVHIAEGWAMRRAAERARRAAADLAANAHAHPHGHHHHAADGQEAAAPPQQPQDDVAAALAAAAAAAGGGGGGGAPQWESKGTVLYHVELVTDVLTHAMTIAHYLHSECPSFGVLLSLSRTRCCTRHATWPVQLNAPGARVPDARCVARRPWPLAGGGRLCVPRAVWSLHGYTLHLVDLVLLMDVRAVASSLLRRLRSYSEYRAATHRLHHAFPDARPGEEEPCSICMEPMQVRVRPRPPFIVHLHHFGSPQRDSAGPRLFRKQASRR